MATGNTKADVPTFEGRFRRTRHTRRARARKLAQCRELLGMIPPAPADTSVDYRDRFEALTGRSLRECSHCHTGPKVVIDRIARPRICQSVPDTS